MGASIQNTLDSYQKGSGFCSEYQTVYDYWSNKPDATYAGYQNTMVNDLATKGYLNRMDLLYIWANSINTGNESRTNWVDPGTFDATLNNTPTWTSLEGWTCTRSGNNSLKTGYTPSTHHINITGDSMTVGLYLRTDVANDFGFDCGCDGTVDLHFVARQTGGADGVMDFIAGSGSGFQVANTISSGMWIGTVRINDTGEVYRNGLTFTSGNTWSATLPDAELLIGSKFTGADHDGQHSIFFLMNEVSDAEAIELMSIFNTYMTSIGKNVYVYP